MKVCVQCGFSNTVGILFCQDCGIPLLKNLGGTTTLHDIDRTTREFLSKRIAGTTFLTSEQDIVVRFTQFPEPIPLPPLKQVVFGRSSEDFANNPHFDLTPYGAFDHGVSRLHAVLQRDEDQLLIIDLNSTNGTYLNGDRLAARESRLVRDGDQIGFGKLLMHVFFD